MTAESNLTITGLCILQLLPSDNEIKIKSSCAYFESRDIKPHVRMEA